MIIATKTPPVAGFKESEDPAARLIGTPNRIPINRLKGSYIMPPMSGMPPPGAAGGLSSGISLTIASV
ncbi:MAG: hypothetical protein OXQ90_01550, partial [Gammaproteobacteria bacterium]|nr:hypothetical protein [Gammaproteobacteria bacterium]